MKFLVIGSNSFSGAYCVKRLLDENHHVLGISRSPEPHVAFLPYHAHPRLAQYRFQQADLNRDIDAIITHTEQFKPDYVINYAAQGMVAESWQSPCDWYQTNVIAQVRLHEALRLMPCIKKYVHITTPEVYGSTEGWIAEHFHFAPSTPYAVSRAACDLHLMSFFKAYQFPVVFTRAANVYGACQQLYRIVPRTMLYGRLGKKLPLHGGGVSERSFIHISDATDGIYKAAIHGTPGETYHLSTQSALSIRALVEKICVLMAIPFSSLVEVSDERLGKDQSYLLSSDKARRELQWKDTITLEAGLEESLAWVDANLATLSTMPLDYIHKS